MEAKESKLLFKTFLETMPPLTSREVFATIIEAGPNHSRVELPAVELFCPTSSCSGRRYFDPMGQNLPTFARYGDTKTGFAQFAYYACRNCHEGKKTFALSIALVRSADAYRFTAFKVGEAPAFGEPRPNVIKDVLDDEIEYFQRGYKAEIEGLGIGAFAYYRRFVESHKDKLIDNLRKVAVAQAAGNDVLAALDRARKTNSFERAVDEIKDAIPPGMRLSGGHNPLTLLHTALSVGVHKDDDAECLSRAQDIRTVLTALATKTTEALADSAELNAAVGRLTNRKTGKPAT